MAQPQPSQPQIRAVPPQMQQRQGPPPPDPVIQAAIDAQYVPVDLDLADGGVIRCNKHKQVVCQECNADYLRLTMLSTILTANPNLHVPPPPNVQNKNLSMQVNKVKEEGNVAFKAGNNQQALVLYTNALRLAMQRTPWESHKLMQEELSAILSNRSAVFEKFQDYINALSDADMVVAIRRDWVKGHSRRAKALKGLGKIDEALDAVETGLAFETENKEMLDFRKELVNLKNSLVTST
ncbi:TPR-like protein [Cylindrobasidium torrendii FP15055 ss-10]|uniref:TPR-like protein n=1 Tax=Cylindrobasidium torrendii FP15055 ss-10 TaxID=1314674 RepID=A0A0D7B8G8_9AGAR|nr:TPR-like protein [Cylindrobasidium torrendii FP15055 ss-10]